MRRKDATMKLNQTQKLLLAVVGGMMALVLVLLAPNAYEKMKNMKCTLWELAVISILLIWCIFSLSGVSTFLYFNF